MSEYFFPKLNAVEALAPYRLRTTWSTGEVLEVDVGGVLHKHAFLAPILDPAVFARVDLGEWGSGIEWIDAELGSDNVYAWAKEQAGEVSHEMFGEWMHRNELSLTTAAEALGIVGAWSATTEPRTKPSHVPYGWPAWVGKPLARKTEHFRASCRLLASMLRSMRDGWISLAREVPMTTAEKVSIVLPSEMVVIVRSARQQGITDLRQPWQEAIHDNKRPVVSADEVLDRLEHKYQSIAEDAGMK